MLQVGPSSIECDNADAPSPISAAFAPHLVESRPSPHTSPIPVQFWGRVSANSWPQVVQSGPSLVGPGLSLIKRVIQVGQTLARSWPMAGRIWPNFWPTPTLFCSVLFCVPAPKVRVDGGIATDLAPNVAHSGPKFCRFGIEGLAENGPAQSVVEPGSELSNFVRLSRTSLTFGRFRAKFARN